MPYPVSVPTRLALGLLAGAAGLLVLLLASLSVPQLRTRVATDEHIPRELRKIFRWTPQPSTPSGTRTLTLTATDASGNVTTRNLLIAVLAPSPTPHPAPSGGGGGGGGGGASGGEGGGGTAGGGAAPPVIFHFEAEQARAVRGPGASVVRDGRRRVVRLSGRSSVLELRLRVPKGTYRVVLQAKHDRPGPVDVALSLGQRVWKRVRLSRNDGVYRTAVAGSLQNFTSGTLRFQFLNDFRDPRVRGDRGDRDFFLDYVDLIRER